MSSTSTRIGLPVAMLVVAVGATASAQTTPMISTPAWRRVRDRIRSVMHRVIGAPDYVAYVAHMARRHPDAVPLSEAKFVHERLVRRYSTPGARCC